MDKLAHDEIRLTLPAAPPFAHIANAAAAGLATRLGFRTGEIDELRVAIAEVWTLVSADAHIDDTVTVTLGVEPDGLSVDLFAGCAGIAPASRHAGLAVVLATLAGVVDEHDVSDDHRRVHLRKARHDAS